MVTLMNDMVDLFFLTDRNFLKKVRLEVLKLFELMNCELKESKLASGFPPTVVVTRQIMAIIKPLLNDA